jgi:hypothetical protein
MMLRRTRGASKHLLSAIVLLFLCVRAVRAFEDPNRPVNCSNCSGVGETYACSNICGSDKTKLPPNYELPVIEPQTISFSTLLPYIIICSVAGIIIASFLLIRWYMYAI